MENIAGNMEKDLAGTAASYSRKRKRWQVLLVKGNGRVLTFSLFQSVLMVLLAVIAALGIAAALLVLFFQHSLTDRSKLQQEAGELRQQNQALRNQVDVLTAKLVLMEARTDEKGTAKAAKADGNTVPAIALKMPAGITADKANPQLPENGAGPDKGVEKKESGVDIRDLAVDYEPEGGVFRSRFVIQENEPSQSSLSGFCFVILKGKGNDPGEWLTLPEATLVNGLPGVPEKGQSFKVSRSKNVTLKLRAQRAPEQFTNAAVMLFNLEGRIIHEQNIPISINIKRRK